MYLFVCLCVYECICKEAKYIEFFQKIFKVQY